MKVMNPTNKAMLIQARRAVPFLAEIPDDIYFQLDHRELLIPEGAISDARRQLEDAFNEHVMTYQRGVFLKNIPIERHLCARLAGAYLTDDQKKLLGEYEVRFKDAGVSFVVYKKPLTLIPVQDSYIYKHLHNEV